MSAVRHIADRMYAGAAALGHAWLTLWRDVEGRALFLRVFRGQLLVVVLLATPLIALSDGDVNVGAAKRSKGQQEQVGPFSVTYDREPKDAPEAPLRRDEEPRPVTWYGEAWAIAARIWSTVFFVQLLVIAFSRDFSESVERHLAIKLGQPVDMGPVRRPRVRMDWKWFKRRAQRRWWMLRPLFVAGLLMLPFAVASPTWGGRLSSAVTALITGWLFVVGTGAKTSRAWDEDYEHEPRFVAAVVRRAVWRPLTWLARLWRWSWKPLLRPAAAAGEHTPELAGLALARVVGLVPIVGLVLRPLVPVAATSLLPARVEPPLPQPQPQPEPEPVPTPVIVVEPPPPQPQPAPEPPPPPAAPPETK